MNLKILSYNIHKGQSWPSARLSLDQIKAAIISESPDLVFLQEVIGDSRVPWTQDEKWRESNQFELLADEIWSHYSYAKNSVYEQGHHGNVILSKFPIIKWNQQDISTNRFEQRGILYCEIDLSPALGKDLSLHAYCLHLNLLHRSRKKQYKDVLDRLEADVKGESPVIVAGDFNDWNKKASEIFEKQFNMKEIFKLRNGDYARSFPVGFPMLCLDRIYIKNIDVNECHVGESNKWRGLSDHCPLIANIQINENTN